MKRLLLTASLLLALALPTAAWALTSGSQMRLAANFDAIKVTGRCSTDTSRSFAGDLWIACRGLTSSAVVRYDFWLPRSQTGTVYVRVSPTIPALTVVKQIQGNRYRVTLKVAGTRTVDIRAISLSYYTEDN